MADERIVIKVLESSAVDWTLLVEAFYESRLYNPAMASITGFFTEEGKENLKHVLREMIETTNCPVIIAWDNGKQKVAGTLMLRGIDKEIAKLPHVDQPGSYKFSRHKWDEQTTQQMAEIDRFFGKQIREFDVWNRYPDCERHAIILSFGVLQEYARMGIGLKLVEKSLNVLRELGYPLVYSVFTSGYSQKIAVKCGFELGARSSYDNYRNFDDLQDEMKLHHKESCVMGRRL